ncbi:MAG: signal recognition particle protein Srp19 [Euryarchaeota archaeon]|nr:signal recognition particle protein Srp19 [Euryarchaeota archaeon]
MPKQENELIIWPVYIDATKSRADGRQISKTKAVPSPKLAEIAKAAEALGLHPKIEREKAYPKEWWEVSGRVIIVERTAPKSVLLKDIAQKIREMRG